MDFFEQVENFVVGVVDFVTKDIPTATAGGLTFICCEHSNLFSGTEDSLARLIPR